MTWSPAALHKVKHAVQISDTFTDHLASLALVDQKLSLIEDRSLYIYKLGICSIIHPN